MFDDGGGGEDDEEDDDEDTADGNVAYAACDLVGAFAKVGRSVDDVTSARGGLYALFLSAVQVLLDAQSCIVGFCSRPPSWSDVGVWGNLVPNAVNSYMLAPCA